MLIEIERTAEEMDQQIEYDMDEEDENFLTSLNTPKKIIAESKLEMLIDRFEKETSRLVRLSESVTHLAGRHTLTRTVRRSHKQQWQH